MRNFAHGGILRGANSAQSAFIPAVKSILVSNDIDEKKRREARRKSLGMTNEFWNSEMVR